MTNNGEMLVVGVREFTQRLKDVFTRVKPFARITVYGEASDLNRWGNGNISFSLKEGESTLACFAWASETSGWPSFESGVIAQVEGAIEVRANRSQYQLHALKVTVAGAGEVAAKIELLRKKLRLEGAFDPSRKREIPRFPRRIALVTADGKARGDFEEQIRARAPFVEVLFVQTKVQGDGAEIEVADALDRAAKTDAELVVLTRGGGSNDDLLTFNLEPVVRAILRAKLPVVTALGHLDNTHLADEVADLSYPTPTAAALGLSEHWKSALDRILDAKRAIVRAYRALIADRTYAAQQRRQFVAQSLQRIVQRHGDRLRALERRLESLNPRARLAQQQSALASLAAKLEAWRSRPLEHYALRVERAQAELGRLSPTAPFARGYAMVTANGEALTDAAAVQPGDALAIRLYRGGVDVRVERVHP